MVRGLMDCICLYKLFMRRFGAHQTLHRSRWWPSLTLQPPAATLGVERGCMIVASIVSGRLELLSLLFRVQHSSMLIADANTPGFRG